MLQFWPHNPQNSQNPEVQHHATFWCRGSHSTPAQNWRESTLLTTILRHIQHICRMVRSINIANVKDLLYGKIQDPFAFPTSEERPPEKGKIIFI